MLPGGGFQPNFPLMAKVEVNGANEEKLFTWLKVSCELHDNENWKVVALFLELLQNICLTER